MTTELLINFLLGVVGSIVAGILLLAVTAFLSEKARWVLTATLGRLLDIDTEYVFANPRSAAADIQNELNRAKFVALLTGRGNELQRETFASLFKVSKGQKLIRILLPNVNLSGEKNDWIEQREIELAAIDPSFGRGMLNEQIKTIIKFLEPYVEKGIIEVKYFNAPHIGRILLTDRCAYFTPYSKVAHGRESHVIKYRYSGDMYDSLMRLFDQLWNACS